MRIAKVVKVKSWDDLADVTMDDGTVLLRVKYKTLESRKKFKIYLLEQVNRVYAVKTQANHDEDLAKATILGNQM